MEVPLKLILEFKTEGLTKEVLANTMETDIF